MRGTVRAACAIACVVGIIPACAGNSRWATPQAVHLRDHPRVCGEQASSTTFCFVVAGSSPRMRGTGSSNNVIKAVTGIIPACAGNRVPCEKTTIVLWDHPRVCGEQTFALGGRLKVMGSSPRVRGTGRKTCDFLKSWGIIPACAGNRRHIRIASSQLLGSSPRVRGTVEICLCKCKLTGIIPACAGNSTRPL